MCVRKGQKHPSASWPSFMAVNYLTAFNWYLQRPFHVPGSASNMRTAVKSRNKASVPWTRMSARGCAVSTHRKGTLSQMQMRAWLPGGQPGKALSPTGWQDNKGRPSLALGQCLSRISNLYTEYPSFPVSICISTGSKRMWPVTAHF